MKPVSDLSDDSIFAEPIYFDFSKGYPEKWEIVLPQKVWEAIDEGKDEVDHYTPMMNYWYPLPDRFEDGIEPEKASTILAKYVPLTLVRNLETNSYGLGLTGSRFGVSWEICKAYMRLGYLPPIHFCELPNLDKKLDTRAKWVIAGCRQSLRIARQQMNWKLSSLKKLRGELKGRG